VYYNHTPVLTTHEREIDNMIRLRLCKINRGDIHLVFQTIRILIIIP